MRIMFVQDEKTGTVTAEPCEDNCTLELAQKLWPAHRPGSSGKVVAVSKVHHVDRVKIELPTLLALSEEAFQFGIEEMLRRRQEDDKFLAKVCGSSRVDMTRY